MANEKPLTLAETRALLYKHATDDPTDTDGEFKSRINEAVERIYGDGLWEGKTIRLDVTSYISGSVLTLPYEYEAAISLALEEDPRTIMDEGLEFVQGGPGVEAAGEGGSTVIDLGFVEESGQAVRKYKFLMEVGAADTVEAILTRRFVYASADTDLIRPSNIGALKHALLALHFEDEGDPKMSEIYWNKCYKILNNQKATENVGVTRTRPGNPWGFMVEKPDSIL